MPSLHVLPFTENEVTLPWLRTTVPATADAPLLLRTNDGRHGLSVRALDVMAASARKTPRGRVFSAALGMDILYVRTSDRIEELRVLFGPHAPHVARYRLVFDGDGASLRLRDQRVELVDQAGTVRLDSAPIFAVDAGGGRIEPTLRLSVEGNAALLEVEIPRGRAAAYPITLDPSWGPGASMTDPAQFVAVKLGSGKVLAAGASVAELFDPATNTWSPAGSFPNPDFVHYSAVLLPSGKVLVVGGASTATRLYDPATNSWSTLAPMPSQRNAPIVELLPSGRVLVAGGENSSLTPAKRADAWEFDPIANTWTVVGALKAGRDGAQSCALADGRILVAAGAPDDYTYFATAEIYNPTTKTFAFTAAMKDGPYNQYGDSHCFRLPSGKVLVTGQIFDPVANTWTLDPGWSSGFKVGAVSTPTGLIAAFGGADGALYNPTTSAWTALPSDNSNYSHVSLGDGRVLAVGGAQPRILYLLDRGQACSSAGQCLSGYCADGVCCDVACASSCVSCNQAGKVGTCTNQPAATPPAAGHPSCAPYATCGTGGVCAATCAADTDCTAGNFCDGTTKKCLPKKANGTGCGRIGECTSNFCIDSVCCNVACTGQCEACDASGSVGTCKAVSGTPHGARTACGTGTGKTCELQYCDGVKTTGCTYPLVSATCSSNACASGIETHASTCDGAGACKDVPKDCGVYKCGATACKTSCTAKTDCIAGYSCVGGACTPSIGLGKPCSDASACGDLLCVDGVCCGIDAPATTCAAGYACNAPKKEGTCTLKNGEKCDLGSKCGSDICTDGVCCDKACDGQCEACDVAGAVGKCTGVAGDPHGTRTKCDDGASDVCKARTCNGAADPKSCVGYVNDSSKLCAPKKCVGSDYTDFSFCDGAGTCKSPGASSCVPYKCDDKGCLKACTDASQCATGFSCKDNKCVQGATCKDITTSVSKDGVEQKCEPYRCRSTGECGDRCTTTDECATGYACDGAVCVPTAATDTGDSGGCAVGSPRPSYAGFALLGLALLGGVGRRRRR